MADNTDRQMTPFVCATQAADVRSNGLGSLAILPDYIINVVLLRLGEEADLARLCCVSRVLRVLASEEPVWYHVVFFAHDGPIVYLVCW